MEKKKGETSVGKTSYPTHRQKGNSTENPKARKEATHRKEDAPNSLHFWVHKT